ncbi:MAG: ATP-binding protein, partial [Deltaproteobacteria bacterium]|nr:ATP-binding protein [Deltaproteobacteria bacterium]
QYRQSEDSDSKNGSLTGAGLRSDRYASEEPSFSFEQLIVPDDLMVELLAAVDAIRVEKTVFDDWGLRAIEPFPRSALNFHGQPGTGKTLAAHALAQRLGRRILVASYAEIESKYHGDGPKNVKALFQAAERDNAVLFIDEADSLLSRRLTHVTQGSEQAINSMRSQLLISLERFRGIVIFATNLVENYDKAFETRVRHLHFAMPDAATRARIWARHLPSTLPVAVDVDTRALGESVDDICGRDIKNAVIDAATRVALANRRETSANRRETSREDLVSAIQRIKDARISSSHEDALSDDDAESATAKLRSAFGKKRPRRKKKKGRRRGRAPLPRREGR